MRQDQKMKPSKVREIVRQVVMGKKVEQEAAWAARATFRSMCEDAALHGLTTADLVRAIFRPVFAKERGCDCLACMSRPIKPAQNKARRVRLPAA